jgi:uncharacterized protein YndB with AHSA1/START domain
LASARAYTSIDRDPATVWAAITDPAAIASWFPGVESCTFDGEAREVTMAGGMKITERIITNDGELRRFQYGLVGLPGFDHHLATIDVLDTDGGSTVVYSTDVEPDSMGGAMQNTVTAAVAALKGFLESS